MKTLHSGTSDFPHVKTETISYSWKFEEAGDHEHPYILTVSVAGLTHSEGFAGEISEAEASAKAGQLAREMHATAD